MFLTAIVTYHIPEHVRHCPGRRFNRIDFCSADISQDVIAVARFAEIVAEPQPGRIESDTIDLPSDWRSGGSWTFYDPWSEAQGRLTRKGIQVALPDFTRSIVVKTER